MAIVQMVPNGQEDCLKAFGLTFDKIEPCTHYGVEPGKYSLVTMGTGRVLFTYERNGYDDSDFYAVYVNDAGEVKTMEYASTRGWTYANGAVADATPEVQAIYARHQRVKAIHTKLHKRAELRTIRNNARLTVKQYKRLWRCLSADRLEAVLKLLSTNLRSPFRKSMEAQIRGWLSTDNPKYNTPLSRKQLEYI